MRFLKQKWVLVALAIVATALTIYYVVPKFTKKAATAPPAPIPTPAPATPATLTKLAAASVSYN